MSTFEERPPRPAFGLYKRARVAALVIVLAGAATVSTAILLQVVAYALVLAERMHAAVLDGADMDEGVIAASVRRDEAVALAVVEELHSPDSHVRISFSGAEEPTPSARRGRRRKRGAAKRLKTVKLRPIAMTT